MGTALSELIAQAAYGKSAWKQACRTVSTANITLSGAQLVNGVSLNVGDRVLVAGQTTSAQNGPYLVSNGPWTRTVDFDTSSDAQLGSRFVILEGTFAGQLWHLASPTSGDITIGVTALTFAEVDGGWPGTVPAEPDASDLYVYNFTETSGTTLASSGTGVNGTLTISGSVQLDSRWLAKSQGSVRFLSGSDAFSSNTASIAGPSYTIEAYVCSRDLGTGYVGAVGIRNDVSNHGACLFRYNNNNWTAGVRTSAGYADTLSLHNAYTVCQHKAPVHLAMTYDGATGVLRFYIDGLPIGSVSTGLGAGSTCNQVAVAAAPGFTPSMIADIAQVRIANVVRSDAYILARAQNCFGL